MASAVFAGGDTHAGSAVSESGEFVVFQVSGTMPAEGPLDEETANAQQAQLLQEINLACHALRAQYKPHKLNVAALGNVVSQLHVHVIARFRDDIAWPRPVWGTATAQPYTPEALVARIQQLQSALG